MQISDLEFYVVEIGRNDSDLPVRSLLVRLVTDSGREGWGEAGLAWRPDELAARRSALMPVLGGRSVFDVEELLTLEVLAQRPLRGAVEMACWDLIGRVVGQPLGHLLGGDYRPAVPLAVRLVADRANRVAQMGRELADQGFHTQIVTTTGKPEKDVKMLAALRESVRDLVEVRFDGMASYDMETARDLCAELEYAGLQFLVDPLNTTELYSLASLGRQTSVPLAVWRAIHGPEDVLRAVRCNAAPVVVVDLDQVGGITPARKCAAVAEAAGIAAALAAGPSLGIATAAVVQMAASTPAFSTCNECAYHQLRDDLLVEPLEIADGLAVVPQGPGLGIEVDRGKVERYQVT